MEMKIKKLEANFRRVAPRLKFEMHRIQGWDAEEPEATVFIPNVKDLTKNCVYLGWEDFLPKVPVFTTVGKFQGLIVL